MVYNALARLPHRLQTHCLLCQCAYITHQQDIPRYFGLCVFCQQHLHFIETACHQCGIPLPSAQTLCGKCIQTTPAFDATCCALHYDDTSQPLIHRLKIQHNNAITRLLSELLIDAIKKHQHLPDIVIPVPMHWRKNLHKGNNHAHLLAKQLCRELQLPLNTSNLQRITNNPAQKQLNAQQRQKNLHRAFHCTEQVEGLSIAIVDDVITTGSTMNAIAQTLKKSGAKEVLCWAVARTPKQL
jgi:ComF family protein